MRVIGFLVACVMAIPAVGSSDQRATPPDVFRTGVVRVVVDVLATVDGRPIPGLTGDDFELLDEGVPQHVALVSTTSSVAVSAVVDHDVERASEALLRAMGPDDRLSILTFGPHLSLRQIDRGGLRTWLSGQAAGGTDATWDAAFTGAALLAPEAGRKLLVLLSDGVGVASWLSERDLVECLRRSDVVAYVVTGPGTRQVRGFEDMARQTGGAVIRAEPGRPLVERFTRVLDEFRARYLLAFEPTGVPEGGGWHRLTVRLRGRPGVITARPGYYSAPAGPSRAPGR